MIKALLLAVIAVIAVDIALWAIIGWAAGPRVALVLALATAALGLLVMLWAVWRLRHALEERLRDVDEMAGVHDHKLRDGESVNDRYWSDMILLVAGVLMLMPGPITDFLGFALLIPAIRRRAARIVTSRLP